MTLIPAGSAAPLACAKLTPTGPVKPPERVTLIVEFAVLPCATVILGTSMLYAGTGGAGVTSTKTCHVVSAAPDASVGVPSTLMTYRFGSTLASTRTVS